MKVRLAHNILFSLSCLLLSASYAFADDFPAKPSPPRLVNDFGGFLSGAETAKLENKLVDFDKKTSTQISIVTIKSLGGYDIADYTAQLGEKWGVGRKGKDNGALILASKDDREVFIATGYGMESIVTDALSKRIVENYIVPNFRQGNFYEGFDEATDVIMQLSTGEFTADDVNGSGVQINKTFLIILIIIVIIMIIISSRMRHTHYTYTGRGRSRSSGWGGPWIGGGGFGGGSWGGGGGGFGGFGGGGFGGGGAGGRW